MIDTKEGKKRVYCAAYCRKSVEERADETFGSIENQHEAILSFIASHKHEDWIALPERYDDNGFTGSNTNRPSLQRLINDIKTGKVNMVVTYKLDRLSRCLADFVQLLKLFEEHNVAFASITQPIDTSTSTGKLMLHILSSFAEFERELISERTKDKMSSARKRGQWLGGRPPLGYDITKDSKKLVVNQEDAKLIREIFALYLKGNSLLKVAQIINEKGFRTKRATSKGGKTFGGIKFGITHIRSMITNVLYLGKVYYAGQIYDGQQEAIIDEETFKKTQEILKDNRIERRATKNTECTGLLSHLLHCKICGHFMFHTYTLKHKTHKYRYYVCSNAQKRGYNSCPTKSVNAQAIEDATVDCLKKVFIDNNKKNDHPNKQEVEAILSPIWDTLYPEEKRRILKALVKEINYDSTSKKLGLMLNDSDIRLEFEVDLKQVRPLNKWHKEEEIEKEPQVRKMLILAHQIQQFVNEGRFKHPREACKWLNLSVTRMDQVMNTLFLCPAIQNGIISSNTPVINALTEFKIRPLLKEVDWHKQLTQWQTLIESKK
ncbi:MAG: recombinase family protein [Candidatus Omnitrophica bacterium]|nr:recombinase family protein [Candidatus Omnitrophota bacterium]MDD5690468.1 recombinase family protein [Candidatus Omnitrophota bacterium]